MWELDADLPHQALTVNLEIELLVIDNADPAHKELALLLVALHRLRCSNDGHPLLNVLLCSIALFAEEVEVILRTADIAIQPEKEIGACNVCGPQL
mgnify:CR=1 FL=1